MQLTTLLISFFLAATALTSPLLAKRDLYNIDGEPIPDFQMEIDKRGHIVPPADWPYYDSLDMQCQGHKNYVPRINVGKWKKECVSKIYQWKVDHNIFESREVAAEAKANEARRRQINEQKHQNRLRDCRRTPKTARCRMLLLEDAKRQEVEEQGGDGEKKAIA